MDNRYKPSGLHGSEAKEYWRKIRTEDLMKACEERNVEVEQKTEFQYRVGGKIDFYPTNGNWHLLEGNKRGDFHTIGDIFKLLSRAGFPRRSW